MAVQWCSNYQYNEPENATGVSVTPSATPFANSSWVEVFVADADCVLTGLTLMPGSSAFFEVDVGVDTGGGETVIATHVGGAIFGATFGWGNLPFRIPIDAIPNGASVRVRMRQSGTSTTAWRWAATFYKKPIVGTILTTTQPQLNTTINPHPTLDGDAGSWVNGDWTAIFSPSSDVVISGYHTGIGYNGAAYVVELGISGTPFFAIKDQNGLTDFPVFTMLKHPVFVASGSTVEARWREEAAFSATLPFALTYYELPL